MKIFETNAYIMTVHDNQLIEFKVKRNQTLTEEHIWQSRAQSLSYMPGQKFFVLLEGEENVSITVGARRAGASKEYAGHVNAVAIYSQRMHESILGNLYLKISKPITKTKFFDDRDKALDWLTSQM